MKPFSQECLGPQIPFSSLHRLESNVTEVKMNCHCFHRLWNAKCESWLSFQSPGCKVQLHQHLFPPQMIYWRYWTRTATWWSDFLLLLSHIRDSFSLMEHGHNLLHHLQQQHRNPYGHHHHLHHPHYTSHHDHDYPHHCRWIWFLIALNYCVKFSDCQIQDTTQSTPIFERGGLKLSSPGLDPHVTNNV